MRKYIEVTLYVGSVKKVINISDILFFAESIRRYSEDGIKVKERIRGSVILTKDGLFSCVKERYEELKGKIVGSEERK